ncbi:hypothetical protein B0T21DRAFT_417137 [Apiosordaria backusii]|uniref:Uncharacterized protein n=1 Tax=Apiosordaria backusii TaxID=314023 RepID=A0AA39ZPS9_9PEZI|nr:hypothetical protein B0T21DRAFT_417137 [Apiosordaria backusii]
MYLPKSLLSLLALTATTTSALAVPGSTKPGLVKDRQAVIATMRSGDNCSGSSGNVPWANGCYPVPGPRRSVTTYHVPSTGCAVRTWSGTNCQGSSVVVGGFPGACWNVLYGSISVHC